MDDMRIMGEITCRLSENAIKPGILYCNEPEAYRLAEWTASGSVITAVATIILAVFAIAAWRSSVRNLKDMERHNQQSIEASQDIALESRQIAFLADYSAALIEMADHVLIQERDIEANLLRVTTTWAAWSMSLFRFDREFRELTGQWNSFIKRLAYEIHTDFAAKPIYAASNQQWLIGMIGQYTGNLQAWQVDPGRRSEIHERFKDIGAYVDDA